MKRSALVDNFSKNATAALLQQLQHVLPQQGWQDMQPHIPALPPLGASLGLELHNCTSIQSPT